MGTCIRTCIRLQDLSGGASAARGFLVPVVVEHRARLPSFSFVIQISGWQNSLVAMHIVCQRSFEYVTYIFECFPYLHIVFLCDRTLKA